jgi:prophage DNA circulation protein
MPIPILPRAAFSGLEFPVQAVRVIGGLRDHVHEYPHVPGGDPEKLGRKLYVVEFDSVFFNEAKAYPNLWPQRLKSLRDLFEAEVTAELMIPTIGPIQAYALDWDQEFTTKMLNGERVRIRFREDQESAFLAQRLVSVRVESLATLSGNFEIQADEYGIERPFTDELLAAVNSVLAIQDQAELFGQLLANKIQNVADLCREFDQRISAFNDPTAHPALEALKDLWVAANELARDTTAGDLVFLTYTVPRLMTISQIATAIYGDSSRAVELMQINPIEDAFAVKAGEKLRYVQAA